MIHCLLEENFAKSCKAISLVPTLFCKKNTNPNYVYILCIQKDLEGYIININTSNVHLCIFKKS